MNTTLKNLIKEQIRKVLKEAKAPQYYIMKSNYSGDMGQFRRGELVQLFPSSEKEYAKEYKDMFLANPSYELNSSIHNDDIPKFLKPVNPSTDTAAMKLLNKWGLVDYGTTYWVISFQSRDKMEDEIKRAKKVTADSPKLAMKKADYGKAGTLQTPVQGKIYVSKFYANWWIIATTEDPKKIGATKISNALKKAILNT